MAGTSFVDGGEVTRLSGSLMFLSTDEPADESIPVLSCTMWWDDSGDLTGFIRFKAKAADGTILTAAVTVSD